ncbi:MAG: HDOD domain-containing protein [Planctomycetaceae bacterium]
MLETIDWEGDVHIPLPSRSVIEFAQLCRRENVSIQELAEKAEQEPGITAELLRHVNSSLMGLRTRVTSTARAIGIVGLSNCASIVLTTAIMKSMGEVHSELLSPQQFRRDCIERATFARVLARYFSTCAFESYTAALLQDLLLPTLTRMYEKEYRLYCNSDDYSCIEDFERAQFGWTHSQLAARTLRRWDFDPKIVEAVLDHHTPPELILADTENTTYDSRLTCAMAALLNDPIRQVPDGVTRLVDIQRLHPGYQLLDVAQQVDEELTSMFPTLRNPVSLMARIQEGMLSQIEYRQSNQISVGRQFGSYVLKEKVAESSMGAIFRGQHLMMRRPTAIKILRVEKTTPRTIAQFEQEAQITSQLHSPHTISVYDFGVTPDELFYYAMEFIDGCTLSTLVETHGPLPEGRVVRILQQACASLAEAHNFDLIHRDIKPDNMMLSYLPGAGDHLTILDFGLAKLNGKKECENLQDDGNIVGTPLYMSPEAAMCKLKLDGRSDLYSLGAVGYFLLSGRPPFSGKRILELLRQHMEDMPPPLSETLPHTVSPELSAIIMSCLAKSPEDRPQSATKLADMLAKLSTTDWYPSDAESWWQSHKVNPVQNTEVEEVAATILG